MPHLFISYSRTDVAFVRRLTDSLQQAGTDIWIDVEGIRSGEDWSDAIQQALDTCGVMILVITPESMDSVNVASEWKYYLDEGKTVIPVMLREARINFRLKPLNYIDFSKSDYDAAFTRLKAELEQKGLTFVPPDKRADKPRAATPESDEGLSFRNLALVVAIAVLALAAVILAASTLIDLDGDDGNKAGAAGEELFAASCSACHGETDGVGPALTGMGERAATRVEGMSAEDYLHESIVDPSAYVVEGFDDEMPKTYSDQFTDEELGDLIAYLLNQ